MQRTKPTRTGQLFLLLRLLVVAAGLTWGIWWLAHDNRWRDFSNVLLQMNPAALVLSLGLFIISMFLIALRWWLLLKTQNIFINFRAAVKLYMLGWFYNNFMPSSVGGDLIRLWYVTRHTDKKFEAGLSVLVDRAVGLLSTLSIAAFFYLVFLRGSGPLAVERKGSVLLPWLGAHRTAVAWFAAVLVAVAAVLCLSAAGRHLLGKCTRAALRLASTTVHNTAAAARLYCSRPLVILEAYAITIFLQLLVITGFWVVGKTMGIATPLSYYYTIFTLVWVLAALPVSIGGAVVAEGIIVVLFRRYAGLEAEPALAIALTQRIVWMLASIPGAVIHISGAHLPKEPLGEITRTSTQDG